VKRFRIGRPSPALVISLVSLFFALGGSAYAVREAVKPPPAQPRCQPGAVRGIALVTGQPKHGIQNLPDTFTTDRSNLGFGWNCTGGAIAVRRVPSTPGAYEVRFVGNKSAVAVGATVGGPGGAVSVQPLGPGVFRVYTFGSENVPSGPSRFEVRTDLEFSLVAF
jgi:hypothetical protein